MSIVRWLRPLESHVEATFRHSAKKDHHGAFYGGFIAKTRLSVPCTRSTALLTPKCGRRELEHYSPWQGNYINISFWLSTKNLQWTNLFIYLCTFSPWVAMNKLLQVAGMGKFSSSDVCPKTSFRSMFGKGYLFICLIVCLFIAHLQECSTLQIPMGVWRLTWYTLKMSILTAPFHVVIKPAKVIRWQKFDLSSTWKCA